MRNPDSVRPIPQDKACTFIADVYYSKFSWRFRVRDSTIRPTEVERTFKENEIIVSKTDLKGIITYANRTFLEVAMYLEEEVLGQPHSMIRHPDMPRCVFKLLWDTILEGNEIFTYVKNMAKNGDYYWVFAHVTPTFNDKNEITGFHSNRRKPDRRQIENQVDGLYRKLKEGRRQPFGLEA